MIDNRSIGIRLGTACAPGIDDRRGERPLSMVSARATRQDGRTARVSMVPEHAGEGAGIVHLEYRLRDLVPVVGPSGSNVEFSLHGIEVTLEARGDDSSLVARETKQVPHEVYEFL